MDPANMRAEGALVWSILCFYRFLGGSTRFGTNAKLYTRTDSPASVAQEVGLGAWFWDNAITTVVYKHVALAALFQFHSIEPIYLVAYITFFQGSERQGIIITKRHDLQYALVHFVRHLSWINCRQSRPLWQTVSRLFPHKSMKSMLFGHTVCILLYIVIVTCL
jgi:hypothetical protein